MDRQSQHYVTGDPAFAVDRQGLVVFWNEAAEQAFGHARPDALGKKCWELMCGHDINGNLYCFENCPLIEMAFLHEPVHAFQSSFDTSNHLQKRFSVSCLTVFEQAGDEMLLHICHAEQPTAQADLRPAPAGIQPDALSQRELEILVMLSKGVRTRDIAKTLDISIRTVRTHIQHLMYKLRVHNRRAAILEGRRLKLF